MKKTNKGCKKTQEFIGIIRINFGLLKNAEYLKIGIKKIDQLKKENEDLFYQVLLLFNWSAVA